MKSNVINMSLGEIKDAMRKTHYVYGYARVELIAEELEKRLPRPIYRVFEFRPYIVAQAIHLFCKAHDALRALFHAQ